MPLEPLAFDPPAAPVPADMTALWQDAEARRVRLETEGHRLPGFVVSDGARVLQALHHIRAAHLAPGPVFLEWGSGLGTATCMAARLGFRAHGIEIHAPLVTESRALAATHAPTARFACGTYVPIGADDALDLAEGLAWVEAGGASGYDALDLDLDDVDLVFAFPWPGEEDVLLDLFAVHAPQGALLLTWHGLDGMQARRQQR